MQGHITLFIFALLFYLLAPLLVLHVPREIYLLAGLTSMFMAGLTSFLWLTWG